MNTAKQIASALLNIHAVTLRPTDPFTWASGIQSPIYTDNRLTLAYPEVRTLIAESFVDTIKQHLPQVEVIAGTATAGIPHGAIIADKMNLPFAYIRSKPKEHGAKNQIEGRIQKGEKVVVIEDLISTGKSVLEAVDAAKREGADVIGVVAIFTYELKAATKHFTTAQVPCFTLSSYSDLIEVAREKNSISSEELELLKRFRENPKDWQ